MSFVDATCAAPECDFAFSGSFEGAVSAERLHVANMAMTAVPPGDPATDARSEDSTEQHHLIVEHERWRWMSNLVALNVIVLIVATIAAIFREHAGALLLFFPQIAVWFVAPAVPAVLIGLAAAAGALYSADRPPGLSRWPRFLAGFTMIGAIVNVGSLALALIMLIVLSTADVH